MKKEAVMNHFIRAVVMGDQIFAIYGEKTKSQELSQMIEDFRASFANQKKELIKVLKDKYMMVDEECTMLQKNAIFLERMKTMTVQNDYDLCIQIIKSMNSAIVGALKYYAKIDDEIREEFVDVIKSTLSNYENIIGKVKTYALENAEYHTSMNWSSSQE